MSWKRTFTNWQVEVDWEGLTLTPLTPKVAERRDQVEREEERERRFNRAAAFDAQPVASEGERQVWV